MASASALGQSMGLKSTRAWTRSGGRNGCPYLVRLPQRYLIYPGYIFTRPLMARTLIDSDRTPGCAKVTTLEVWPVPRRVSWALEEAKAGGFADRLDVSLSMLAEDDSLLRDLALGDDSDALSDVLPAH